MECAIAGDLKHYLFSNSLLLQHLSLEGVDQLPDTCLSTQEKDGVLQVHSEAWHQNPFREENPVLLHQTSPIGSAFKSHSLLIWSTPGRGTVL